MKFFRSPALAAAAGAALVLSSPTIAEAHPDYHYLGGCGFDAIPGRDNGSQTQWDGFVYAAVVATDAIGTPAPTTPITVECIVYRNGADPVVVARADGVGVAATAAQWSFSADPDDVLTFCAAVTVVDFHFDCDEPLPSMMLSDIHDAFREDLIDVWEFWELIERLFGLCDNFSMNSGGPADQPPTLDIRSDGDLYIAGARILDCPPYGESGS